VLEVRDLTVKFRSPEGDTVAVDHLSFSLEAGATLAVVGESGSGKSVTALALTRLLPEPPAEIESGAVLLDGTDILRLPPERLRRVRGKQFGYVFQEPSTSLNPVYNIHDQIAENIRRHRPEVREVRREVLYWLDQVGIANAERRLYDYPFQLSGGMQQRVMIAMALSARPQLLIADEPTTALDVTIQKQVLDLLRDLKNRFDMSIILITHNFGIIGGLAEKVAVMFRGKLVEFGLADEILRNPQHPYTRALIECVPRLGAKQRRLKTIDYATIDGRNDRQGRR
jgi:ABC-type dipeptide/oligopeptide/nickel transport system ATPase component